MNITLMATHQFSFSEKIPLHKCLGVLTLASCLRERNLDCKLTIPDLSDFHNLARDDFYETMEKAAVVILDTSPDIVGFSTMTPNLPFALTLCKILKQKNKRIKSLLGGPGASCCANLIIETFPAVDFIIRGEADRAFPDFVERQVNGEDYAALKGIVYKKKQTLVDNGWPDPIENLDSIPAPAFDLCKNFGMQDNTFGTFKGIELEVGRGCPYNCTFCSTSHFFKRKYRTKSVSRVIREIQSIQNITGTNRIIFNHDLLTFNREYVEGLCSQIANRFPDLTWKCHARIDTVDHTLLTKMKKSGCNEIFFGIECATKRMQKIIRKNLNLDRFDEITMALHTLGFTFNLSFIVGLPEEKIEDITAVLETVLKIKYLSRKKAIIKLHMLVPLGGSDLYHSYSERLVFSLYGSFGTSDIPKNWDDFRELVKPYPEIFTPYFFIDSELIQRKIVVKLEMIGVCIENHLTNSLLIAYNFIGDSFAQKIIQHIDEIKLPPPDTIENTRFDLLNASLCDLISSFITDNPRQLRLFETVSQFEMALYQVKNDKNAVILIETFYSPVNVIQTFDAGAPLTNIPESETKRYFMIKKDTRDGIIKSTELNEDLMKFLMVRPDELVTGKPD